MGVFICSRSYGLVTDYRKTGTWHKPSEPFDPAKVHHDLPYTEEDDKAIDDWVADHVETTWHSLGTCAMKPREQGGVVDKRLNVYGTENLKCVDLSICPVSDHLCSGYCARWLMDAHRVG